ncbi:MAG: LysE family translocator [Pseudomonadota bacterium]
MSEYLAPLLIAWGIQWMGVLSPGPGVALILSVAASQGRTAALITCLGIGSASIVLAIATVVGLAALFAEVAAVMAAIKFIGAAYLAWLSYTSFRKAVAPPKFPKAIPFRESGFRAALAGLTMQVTNPKAIFFWLAIAAIGDMSTAPLPILVLFVAGAFVNSVLGHGAWAIALSSSPFLALYRRARRGVEATLGAFFAFAAFKLATSRT